MRLFYTIDGAFYGLAVFLKKKRGFQPRFLSYFLILPDEVIIDGFSSVHKDALSRAERIDHG